MGCKMIVNLLSGQERALRVPVHALIGFHSDGSWKLIR